MKLRKQDSIKFVQSKEPWLELELEPDNQHDPNAIKIIGRSKGLLSTKKYHIGYLYKEISAAIYACQPITVIIRLHQTYINLKTEFTEIRFSISGPKDRYKEFQEAVELLGQPVFPNPVAKP